MFRIIRKILNFFVKITYENEHKVISFSFIKFKIKRLKNALIKNMPDIVPNKIVFSNYFGKSFGCNPKYIAYEIINQKLPYELVWLVADKSSECEKFPKEIRLENYYSEAGIKELLSAKIWVDNMRKPFLWKNNIIKRAGQKYIQTWHGSLGIKKIEGDFDNEDGAWRYLSKKDSENIDCIIAGSKFEYDLYSRYDCFWYKGDIKTFGHPRNDIFFRSEEERKFFKEQICNKYGINPENKLILYVPTFRDKSVQWNLTIDAEKVKKAAKDRFGFDYEFLIRFHPLMRCKKSGKQNKDVSDYSDIQELLFVSDILISDYSSCMFDFMLTKRPVFVYADDIEQYNNERGFYYQLETTPFPIAVNNDDLVKNILEFDEMIYKQEAIKFLEDKQSFDDGNASKKVVELIKQYMKEVE